MKTKLTVAEIEKLDPYQFMAELGKNVIHPGGKQSTSKVYSMANLKEGQHVLDIGCGVGTTAIDIAKQFGCFLTVADIDQKMLDKTFMNVKKSGLTNRIKIEKADIQNMPFPDNEFDVVIIEAVTMFVNRKKAVQEIFRVCKNGGRIVEHEFIWRKKPTLEARRIFEGEVCPGIKFDTSEDWIKLYEENGFKNEDFDTGPFVMMSPSGFIKDEGIVGTIAVMLKTLTRLAYIKKMMWMMPRMIKVRNMLGYIVFSELKSNYIV